MPGFGRDAFEWFEGLERDNSREYFHAHKAVYDASVRGALEALLAALSDEFGGRVRMFRQNRDVRFSRDKSPYKTTTYGLLVDRPGTEIALYAELSREGLYAGTGIYEPAKDQLKRYREAVADDASGPELAAAVASAEAAGLEIIGRSLKTAPRGYPRDHPRIELLRRQDLIAGRDLAPGADGIAFGRARDFAAETWRAAAPIGAWLDAHVGASELPPEERRGR